MDEAPRPKRRPRYRGTHPRRFDEKYKERDPEKYPETVAKVVASGKTPAGSHRPILVDEVMSLLEPKPGDVAVDATLGWGGHAAEILPRILPGGRLLAMDADPIELPKTEARLHALGFGPDVLFVKRMNFAGLPKLLAAAGLESADLFLADLGVSSMQLDEPARGFSYKLEGPLDLRMNPDRGAPASALLAKISKEALARLLRENADEAHADLFAEALVAARAESPVATTRRLADVVRKAVEALPSREREEAGDPLPRVFQALRVEVNDELGALDALLGVLPSCLSPGARAAFLTFHSGEDRRVKKALAAGLAAGVYARISREVVRASAEEKRANPRSTAAKLRWAV
ncbi:MAG TPA: 16S rRNA (cytosine(1402)-N(4))-methyltransferase RsmH, partial [Thermoanaerobaculia bacterium]|nr:16S rRNA (cytosine(1402)-N(4))-methyltransferase RsmH [Thermoanaerobaculia bacterium]